MVRADTRTVGLDAEQIAFRYLTSQGLSPVNRNFRCRRGEIDIIMRDVAVLVFVEVRYRAHSSFVHAMLTVDRRKQRKLINTAAIYLATNPKFQNHVCRFDVVGIDRNRSGDVSINWLQDAFRTDT